MRLRRWPGSLRGQLVIAAVLAGTLFSAIFGVLATWRVQALEDSSLRGALRARLSVALDELNPDGSLALNGASRLKTNLVQVVNPDGTVRSATAALTGAPALVSVARAKAAGSAGVLQDRALERPDTDIAALGVPIRLPALDTAPAGTGALVVAVDTEGFLVARRQFTEVLAVGLVAVVAAMGLLAWLLAGRALRTVANITEEAEAVSVSDVGRGLPVPGGDAELSRLVTALNRMLRRVHAAYARDVAFANDASHHLRTPLATLRAEAELALAGGSAEEMHAALAQVIRDADDLARIIDRMLAVAGGRYAAAPVPLGGTVERLADRWSRQAAGAGLRLEVRVEGDGAIDARLLAAILDPLVENAIQHTPAPGRVQVGLVAKGGELTAEVINEGPGVPEPLRDRLFEPWVSGGGDTTARGLGLWLARESARAAGGELELAEPAAGRTTFRARLPLATPAELATPVPA